LIPVYHASTPLTILLNGKISRLFTGKGKTEKPEERTELRRAEFRPARQETKVGNELSGMGH